MDSCNFLRDPQDNPRRVFGLPPRTLASFLRVALIEKSESPTFPYSDFCLPSRQNDSSAFSTDRRVCPALSRASEGEKLVPPIPDQILLPMFRSNL